MPRGNFLMLGRVLLMYWHKMTRLIRDMVFLQASDITEPLILGPSTLTPTQLDARK